MEGVRSADEADVPRLLELAEAYRAENGAQKGGRLWLHAESEAGLAEHSVRMHLDDPGSEVLIGLIDDVDVGYALVVDVHRIATLFDLYIEPAARGVGVGSALLEAAVAWARERSCVGIDAFALPGSRATKNFFEAHGLVTRLLTVHRDLS